MASFSYGNGASSESKNATMGTAAAYSRKPFARSSSYTHDSMGTPAAVPACVTANGAAPKTITFVGSGTSER